MTVGAQKTDMPDADAQLRALITRAIRRCPKKRSQIAEELSIRLGQRVTPFMLDSYTSTRKKPARFPAVFIECFCEAVGSDELKRHILGPALRSHLEVGEYVLAAVGEELARELRAAGRRRAKAGKK